MFWSLDSLEEQTFGQLVAAFRRRRGLSQADVAPLLASFGFRFPPQISLLEGGTWPARPDRGLVQEFTRLYTLSPREESYLLRQADIPPSATEQQSVILRFAATMLEFSSPACILNAHWQLVAWNEPFAAYYDGSTATQMPAPSVRAQRPDPSLQAASAPSYSSLLPTPGRNGSPDDHHSESTGEDSFLVLKENLNFLVLLFSRRSRLRASLATDEWYKLARYFLIRFWRSSLPLFNQHWHSPSGPAWIQAATAEAEALAVPDNQEFLEMSNEIRSSLESEGGWANPHVQLTNTFLHDRLIFRAQRWQLEVIPTVMSDARFLFVQFQHAYAPLPLTEMAQQRFL